MTTFHNVVDPPQGVLVLPVVFIKGKLSPGSRPRWNRTGSPWGLMSVVVTFSTKDPGQWSIPESKRVIKTYNVILPLLSSSGGVVHVQKCALKY